MTAVEPHDGLCPWLVSHATPCSCDLIARVREDERGKVNDAWEETWSRRSGEYEANGFGLGLAAAIAAIEALGGER